MGQAATINNTPKRTQNTNDFWLVHSDDEPDSSLGDTLHAMYYLPENYRLIIVSDDIQKATMQTMGHFGLKKRIKLTQKTETSKETSPFLVADAIVTNCCDTEANKPVVVVAGEISGHIQNNDQDGFSVSAGNPPALASAVLKIAHAA